MAGEDERVFGALLAECEVLSKDDGVDAATVWELLWKGRWVAVWRSVEVCDGAVVGLPMGVNVGSGGGDGVGVLLVIVWVVVGGAISDGVGV